MPAIFCHYTFGKSVLESMTDVTIKKSILKHRTYFDLGLHGPDLLFYYHPLKSNPISKIGYDMHEKEATAFFDNARKVIISSPYPEESLAYILGFICHFILDSNCHGYVAKTMQETNISHTEIESQWERRLLKKEQLDPLRHPLTNHIIDDHEHARVMAPFFSIDSSKALKSLQSIKFYNRILIAPGIWKRGVIYTLLRITNNYQEMHGLLIGYQDKKQLQYYLSSLDSLFYQSIEETNQQIENYYHNYLTTMPLDQRFNRNYE